MRPGGIERARDAGWRGGNTALRATVREQERTEDGLLASGFIRKHLEPSSFGPNVGILEAGGQRVPPPRWRASAACRLCLRSFGLLGPALRTCFPVQVHSDGTVPAHVWNRSHLRTRHPHRHGRHPELPGHVSAAQRPVQRVSERL